MGMSVKMCDDIFKGDTTLLGKERPKGEGSVLTPQTEGFWGKLEDEAPAYPEFTQQDLPSIIYTFAPWLGCLWGESCKFCYVPNASLRFYPGGRDGYWYQEWGHWLIFKEDITARLRAELIGSSGQTKPRYLGACIFMSPKTDPFLALPRPDTLEIVCEILDIIGDANVFLMNQTRSLEVVNDERVFQRLSYLGALKKVGVSFSISTDLPEQQKKIECSGATPVERLEAIAKLKNAGIFVSAAVSPLMPFSPDFVQRLVVVSHHASIQLAKPSRPGATTPKDCLEKIQTIEGYDKLDKSLSAQLMEKGKAIGYSWGINNKGFAGAFLAAKRFYES